MEKNFSFFANENRSQDLIFDSLLYYLLFYLVIVPVRSYILVFVNIYNLSLLFRS